MIDKKENKKEFIYSFVLNNEINEEYIFKCETEDQLKSWMKEIEQIVGHAYLKESGKFN